MLSFANTGRNGTSSYVTLHGRLRREKSSSDANFLDFSLRKKKVILSLQRKSKMVDVAQSVRASDCGSEGRRFETDLPPRWRRRIEISDSPFFYFFSVGENGNSDENQVVSCNITR